MDLGLKGKVAMVGGASRGLGHACALELAREGAAVSICSRDAGGAGEAARSIAGDTGATTVGFGIDLSASGAPEEWVRRTEEELGPVDILVHNTGGPPPGDFDDVDDDAWRAAFDLLVLSAVRLYRQVVPGMKARGWGRIVAIESMSVREPIDGLLLSNALRPAVVAINKSLSRGLAADGVLFNTVAPGVYDTARRRQLAEARAKRAGISTEEMLERIDSGFPRRRPGDPAELAAVVAFLCSERAANVTGATVVADGGSIRALS